MVESTVRSFREREGDREVLDRVIEFTLLVTCVSCNEGVRVFACLRVVLLTLFTEKT